MLSLRDRGRHGSRWLILIALLALSPPAAAAGIDLTGNWRVTSTLLGFPLLSPVTDRWVIIQTGETLTISSDGLSAPFYIGSIVPETGAFTFGGNGGGCFSSDPDSDSFTGTATNDAFEATGLLQIQAAPFHCSGFGARLAATRIPCGNGTIDPGEQCDDGDLVGSGCCSPTCTVRPNGSACEDDDGETAFNVCVAGSCIAPAGIRDLQANTTTSGREADVAVACDGRGGFVVAWERGDTMNNVVFARRYTRGGAAVGSEITVDEDSPRFALPEVAADASGNFVVVWEDAIGSGVPIVGRRFGGDGRPIGSEFQVSSHTTNRAAAPQIAMAANGTFVVAWSESHERQPAFVRRFDPEGVALGSEIQVNDPNSDVGQVFLAGDAAGGFVVVWGRFRSPDGEDVAARRFDSLGRPVGNEFRLVNRTGYMSLGANPAGDFALVLQQSPRATLELFTNTGAPLGREIPLADPGSIIHVALDAARNVVTTWEGSDGSGSGIRAQRLDSDGTLLGSEFQANDFTFNTERAPDVCATGAGDFVVAWESDRPDGSISRVLARRFAMQCADGLDNDDDGLFDNDDPDCDAPMLTPLCAGDCDDMGSVLVGELVRCVNVALDRSVLTSCGACDADGDGRIEVTDLVVSVNNLLAGC